MTITLGTLLTDVRSRLDEPVAALWADSDLTNWINEGLRDLARRTESLLSSVSIPTTANLATYVVTSELIRIHTINFTPTSAPQFSYPLEFKPIFEMNQVWGIYQGLPSAYPAFYTLWQSPPNLEIQVYPVPAQTGNLNVFYYRLPTVAVNTGDILDVVEGWWDAVAVYAEYVALRKGRDPRWQEARGLYEQAISTLMEQSKQYTDSPGGITRGIPNGLSWLTGGY